MKTFDKESIRSDSLVSILAHTKMDNNNLFIYIFSYMMYVLDFSYL